MSSPTCLYQKVRWLIIGSLCEPILSWATETGTERETQSPSSVVAHNSWYKGFEPEPLWKLVETVFSLSSLFAVYRWVAHTQESVWESVEIRALSFDVLTRTKIAV